jgi:hypothetical protein
VIRRVRMARKRLAIARERSKSVNDRYRVTLGLAEIYGDDPYIDRQWRVVHRHANTLRAIERRKDAIK